jgi:ketosteroid isomerase-like protein
MKTILVLSISFILALNGFCQPNNTSEAFINIMKTEFEAFKKKDPAAWLEYVDDSAVFSSASNTLKTRDQIVEEMKNAPAIFNSATETYENVNINIYGNTAILSCVTTFSFTSENGQRSRLIFHFTRVHVKEGNIWKLVYHSAIPI